MCTKKNISSIPGLLLLGLLIALGVTNLLQPAPSLAEGGEYVFTSAKESLQALVDSVPSGSVIEIKLRELKLTEALVIPAGKEIILIGNNTALSSPNSTFVIQVRGQLQARYLKIFGGVEAYEAILILENCRLQSQKKGTGRAITSICGGQTVVSNCYIADYEQGFLVVGGATLRLKNTYFSNNRWLGRLNTATLSMTRCEVHGDALGLIASQSTIWIEDCLLDKVDMALSGR